MFYKKKEKGRVYSVIYFSHSGLSKTCAQLPAYTYKVKSIINGVSFLNS